MAKEWGRNWKWYLNTGTEASPTWTLIPNQKDGPFSIDPNMVETTTKSDAGWTTQSPTTKSWEASISVVLDLTDSTHLAMVNNAQDEVETEFKLVAENGQNWIVFAWLGISVSDPVDNVATMDVTLNMSRAPTYAAS
jgi:hypothetical protein